ncbi:MAG: class IV adenylate cyclase [Candidatus Hodarchaeota archaeon]
MLEVEIKVRILDPNLIRKQFEENNGVYKISLLHEDTYFNLPKGLRDFKKTDEALRLRKAIEFNKDNREITEKIVYFIAYKGKKVDTTTKSREEIEIKIEDVAKMRNLLNALGFQEIFTVKKERELYKFKFKNYNIVALIDFLPILKQHFIEVEIISDSIESLNIYREILFDFLSLFGIKKEESIRKSYLELIADKFKGKF